MVINLCVFIASLNHALLTGQRSLIVPKTTVNRDFVLFLRTSGYLLGYHMLGSKIYVYPNHLCPGFSRISAVSTPSRSVFFKIHRIKQSLKSGHNYLLYINGVFRDSHTCVLENLGGYAVARIYLRF